MVPNISRENGTSFTGAGAYYLHDKPFKNEKGEQVNPTTSERVLFTVTRNLANDDPQKAMIEMWRTADAQALIKAAAGLDARGRKCTDPVKTISLAWRPDQDPTNEQMIAAADGFLKHMGWQEHQAVYVAHNDTAHAHIHIILNRVHPETGRTLDDFRERKRAQPWAKAYERENGGIICEKRIGKDYGTREPNSATGIPNTLEKDGKAQEEPFLDAAEVIAMLDGSERDVLHDKQRQEREAFFGTAKADFREARRAAFHEVKADFKSEWRAHFEEAKMLRAQARELSQINAQKAFAMARGGNFGPAWNTLNGTTDANDFNPVEYAENHIAEKAKDIAGRQREARKERQDDACAKTFEARNARFQEMKERQSEDRRELRDIAARYGRGESVDIDRLRALLTNDPAPATNPAILMAQLHKANDNATPLDNAEAANDNRAPQQKLEAQRIKIAARHMENLIASVRLTNSPGMASVQTQALKDLAKRTRRDWQERPQPQRGEITDRVQRLGDADQRTEAERIRDRERYGPGSGRDRGGGRDR